MALYRSSTNNSFLTTNVSVLERMLSIRRKSDDNQLEIRGALGLNTLWSPSEPLIEYIFVHGLGGGSRKTWSISEDPNTYWPKAWLSKDPAFKHARIHSFGYNANWTEAKESALNVHDFGQSLLDALWNSPHIRSDEDNPLVLVGHSMGGLVIKQAYILAKGNPTYTTLASRFHTMVFLATPHRGSDFAAVLNNILRASIGRSAKGYIANLERNSEMLCSINESFRHFAPDVALYSYYETQDTNLGLQSGLIVKKESATLGYPGEQVALLNANHRGVCKFNLPSDPNYRTLRNAFQTINEGILKKVRCTKLEGQLHQMRQIETYLDANGGPEDDLSDLEEVRISGSCEWFSEKPEFQGWADSSADSPPIYWVSANPATGKSILSSYIIGHLKSLNLDCSYYFFHHGSKAGSSVSGFLLSMAYQMAMISVSVRKKLLGMIEHDIRFDKDDERATWRKLFDLVILRDDYIQTQYWVIDALDECANVKSFFQIISRIETAIPIRIFITSRNTLEIVNLFSDLQKRHRGHGLTCDKISSKDTLHDIILFLQANEDKIRVESDRKRQEIISKIIAKSQGCFLWVRLVLEELNAAWSSQQVEQVLEEVPQEMGPLYARAIAIMSSKPLRNKRIAKAILVWTMCATRPLSVAELKDALQLDILDVIDDLEHAIPALCGQLVYVDKHSRVQMIHLTARAYLLDEDLESEFAVDKRLSHAHLAELCLTYLNSDELKPPRARRGNRETLRQVKKSAFVLYASESFSEHMRQTSSHNHQLAELLDEFLRCNVLSWIEYVATTGNLYHLTQTGKILNNYLQRQAQYLPPIGAEVARVKAWAIDLVRLVAKFGKNLIESPSAIHWLIPPFCPSLSAIGSQFSSNLPGISVHGLTDTGWDDRLGCIDFQNCQATALHCGESYFAVGLSSGWIVLFQNNTCQEWKRLHHVEPLRHLRFDASGSMLVSSSRKILKVWDVESGTTLWQWKTSQEILSFAYGPEDKSILAALRGNTTCTWNIVTGSAGEELLWKESFNDQQVRRPPNTAAFNPERSILAVVYRGRPITLWDMKDEKVYGFVGREPDPSSLALGTNTSVSSLIFCANEANPFLAAAYEDGDLALFKYWDRELVKVSEVNAQIVASSPDGCILATGNSAGMVQLFEFDTLQLLYRVNTFDFGVRCLAFSSDNLRFLDVRGKQCNVWEPSAILELVKKDQGSFTDPLPVEPRIIGIAEESQIALITAMAVHESGNYIFYGATDGSVYVSENAKTSQRSVLYSHTKGVPITSLVYGSEHQIIITADTASRFIAQKLVQDSTTGVWKVEQNILDSHSRHAIIQLLLNPSNELLLVSTTKEDSIWNIPDQKELVRVESSSRLPSYWANHPINGDERILISASNASVWDWKTCIGSTPARNMKLNNATQAAITDGVKNVLQISQGQTIIIELSHRHGERSTTHLLLYHSADFASADGEARPRPEFDVIRERVLTVIGSYGSRLVFLDRDLWVCSVDVEKSSPLQYIRHFFTPSDWYSQQKNFIMRVTPVGDVIVVKRNEIAVIRNGLEFEELVRLPGIE